MPPQSPQQLDQDVVRLARSIRKIESGDNFQARGGSGEFGAYQYTPATWAARAPKYLGREVPLEAATPQEQNEVQYKWMKEQKDKGYNIGQIASMHNAGEGRPNAYLEGNKGTNQYGVSYDTGAYAQKVATEYQRLKEMGGSYQPPQNTPQVQPIVEPEKPKGDLLSQASDFLNVFFPTKNIGNVIGTQIAKIGATPEERKYIQDDATLGGVVGDVAQNAALFVGGGAIPAVRGATLASKVGSGALAGAKYGAAAGAIGGSGRALSEGGDLGDAAGGAVGGALTGGVLGGALGGLVPAIPGVVGRVAGRGTTPEAAQMAAGRVVQGTEAEGAAALRGLQRTDTTGVKTYDDLAARLQDEIDKSQAIVDTEFGAQTTPFKIKAFEQTIESGIEGSKLAAKVNYVDDALKQLKQLYRKTREVKDELRVTEIAKKARKEGLTPAEINQIAREYGREFKAKGFNKIGQPLTTVNDQAFENTRKGIKATARGFLKGKGAEEADMATSELIKTKELVEKMREKVLKLSQRVEKRNLVENAARLAGRGVDLITFGGPKAFITKLFFPSNVGLKTLNSLDIQAQLERNLKIIQKLEKAPDSDVEKFLRRLLGGDGVPGAAAPQKKSSQLTSKDFPRDASLKGEDAAVQERAIEKYLSDPQGLVQAYLKENGNLVNTDEARKLFTDVGYRGTNSAAVHEPASKVSTAAMEELIKKAQPGQDAFFMAGSSGSGKTTAVRGRLNKQLNKAAFVLDGNLSSYEKAAAKIKQAEDAGLHPTITYVYRDPVEAFNKGVVGRMLGSGRDGGRVVPLKEFMGNLTGSLSTVKKLIADGVPTVAFRNGTRHKISDLSLKQVRALTIPPGLQQRLVGDVVKLARRGKITADQYEALLHGIPHPSY